MSQNYPLVLLKKLDSFIEKLEGWALILILATMMLVAFTQVVLRNLFSTGISWGDGLTRMLVLWAGFLGASLAVKQGRYINVDAFSRLLGERQRWLVRAIIYVFASTVCVLLGMAGVSFVKMEYETAGKYSIGIDAWLIESIIPVVFFFIAFRFALKLLCLLSGEPMEKQEWER